MTVLCVRKLNKNSKAVAASGGLFHLSVGFADSATCPSPFVLRTFPPYYGGMSAKQTKGFPFPEEKVAMRSIDGEVKKAFSLGEGG